MYNVNKRVGGGVGEKGVVVRAALAFHRSPDEAGDRFPGRHSIGVEIFGSPLCSERVSLGQSGFFSLIKENSTFDLF